MVRPGVAVDTSMFTAAIWIDAGVESNVGTVVIGDNAARFILQEDGVNRRIFRLIPLGSLIGGLFESIYRIAGGPSAPHLLCTHRRIIIP
jgi:hypothetical protein